jgi:hypothetical protein
MSLAALVVVFAQIAVAGVARQVDEGAAAHTWQLLMAGQTLLSGASPTIGVIPINRNCSHRAPGYHGWIERTQPLG